MPTLTGSITISDLLDGVTGATIVISNESHTFIADADGQVVVDEDNSRQLDYSTTLSVFVGSEEYTYTADATPGSSEFTIGTLTDTPAAADLVGVVTATPDPADSATIVFRDGNTGTNGFVDQNTTTNSATIAVPVTVNIAGTSVTTNKTISFTKAIGGDAKLVRVNATRQTMEYAFGATAPKTTENDIVFTATTLNFGADSEATVWTRSLNGGTFANIPAAEGTPSGTDNKTLTVSPTQFDASIDAGTEITAVTYRATAGGVFDQVTAVLLRDAEGGYSVIIEVDEGVQVFKNDPDYVSTDPTTYCDLNAILMRGGIDISNNSGTTYAWSMDGTLLDAASELALLGVAQPSGYGRATRQIRVGANAIDDNGSNRFSVAVTF